MARPCKSRTLEGVPRPVLYIPSGWTQEQCAPAEVAIEDFEVFRLVDGHAHTIEEAARKLGVSRSTAGRMLERSRRALALAMERHLPIYIDASDASNLSSPKVVLPDYELGSGSLAVAVDAPYPDAPVARIFGRASVFALVGPQSGITYLNNPGTGVMRGAAISAVEQLRVAGVARIAAGRFGVDALELLGAASIEPLLVTGMKLSQVVELFTVSKK